MPIYEYRCRECQNVFEEMVFPNLANSLDAVALECPACGGHDIEKLLSSGSFRPHGIPKGKGGWKLPKCARERN